MDEQQHETVIDTLGGVEYVGEVTGTATVIFREGATMVDLEVTDRRGKPVVVHLGYREATALMVALGRFAAEL